jgi:hypothetical protein
MRAQRPLSWPFEPLAQSAEGFFLDVGRDVRVGVHGVGYARMAQDLLNNLGVLALFEHEGCKGVPEVVILSAATRSKRTSCLPSASRARNFRVECCALEVLHQRLTLYESA